MTVRDDEQLIRLAIGAAADSDLTTSPSEPSSSTRRIRDRQRR